jgi:hypothetical protein
LTWGVSVETKLKLECEVCLFGEMTFKVSWRRQRSVQLSQMTQQRVGPTVRIVPTERPKKSLRVREEAATTSAHPKQPALQTPNRGPQEKGHEPSR